jgi:hypothetical protein
MFKIEVIEICEVCVLYHVPTLCMMCHFEKYDEARLWVSCKAGIIEDWYKATWNFQDNISSWLPIPDLIKTIKWFRRWNMLTDRYDLPSMHSFYVLQTVSSTMYNP